MKAGSDTRRDVADQLRSVRKAQGMTQESLAERVGTKKSNISRLESVRYNPCLDFLVKVADGLGKQIQIKVKSCAVLSRAVLAIKLEHRGRKVHDEEAWKVQGQ